MEFSSEELEFFNNIFAEKSTDYMTSDSHHKIGVKAGVPQNLRQVLVGSQLTLLAEISHYQLWFPVSLSINEQGDFSPKLGTPEVIDVRGHERSWRIKTPKNVAVVDIFHDQKIEILSLSATGLTLKVPNSGNNYIDLKQYSFEMSLAGEEPLKLELDIVRRDKNIVAAKFKDLQEGKEALRKFLFNSHQLKYSNLYQDVI
ncbi:hypothetical protein ESZ36_02570 [Colwellia demingiae]|uniref:PilZ domain-containing protein n=1 Tax=Colwellia demingiae TaxID=89401 RepID=A0A5C6QTY6_9GAMM|nr:hypothetical protein [Colwellia demingiae]TWX72123.1 hypothetical protein ESZ36_02570 [Colwellia demingiae]